MNWSTVNWKPAIYLACSLVLGLSGGAVGKTVEHRAGAKREAVVRSDCARSCALIQARADSIAARADSLQSLLVIEREARIVRHAAVRSATVYRQPERRHGRLHRVLVPALSFVAGAVVGHLTGHSEISTAVTVINHVRSGGHHGGHRKPNHKR